ncbi:MAG: hypothetical protein H6707_17080 [Deltaproteobacteria bacterium]|nr:hypothetical protein [Deltaproteobacteria bacterium]
MSAQPKATLLIDHPLRGQQIGKVLSAAGLGVDLATSLAEPAVDQAALLLCPFARHAELSEQQKRIPSLLWLDSARPHALGVAERHPAILGLLGLRYPDAPPRQWELLAIGRRVVERRVAPPNAPLRWGHSFIKRQPRTTADRDALVAEVESFASALVRSSRAAGIAELAHELLMNAMYDAPVGEDQQPLFAHRRTESIALSEQQTPSFGYGTDGDLIVLSVRDPFGRLRRRHVFGNMHRALTQGGEMDQSGGGAGLGMAMFYQAATVLFFDVVKGKLTQVTAVIELDVPQRELRTLPRSVHFFGG